MAEEGDFPTSTDDLAASTKRLADWTFSLQGVGADLKALMTEFKTYWRTLMPTVAMEGTPVATEISEPKSAGFSGGVTVRQGSNVNVNRFTLPKDPRELIIAIILAASVLTNFYLWAKVRDADKDIQTQVWLRDDALTKFEQGPFADMKAHVLALELIQKEKR